MLHTIDRYTYISIAALSAWWTIAMHGSNKYAQSPSPLTILALTRQLNDATTVSTGRRPSESSDSPPSRSRSRAGSKADGAEGCDLEFDHGLTKLSSRRSLDSRIPSPAGSDGSFQEEPESCDASKKFSCDFLQSTYPTCYEAERPTTIRRQHFLLPGRWKLEAGMYAAASPSSTGQQATTVAAIEDEHDYILYMHNSLHSAAHAISITKDNQLEIHDLGPLTGDESQKQELGDRALGRRRHLLAGHRPGSDFFCTVNPSMTTACAVEHSLGGFLIYHLKYHDDQLRESNQVSLVFTSDRDIVPLFFQNDNECVMLGLERRKLYCYDVPHKKMRAITGPIGEQGDEIEQVTLNYHNLGLRAKINMLSGAIWGVSPDGFAESSQS